MANTRSSRRQRRRGRARATDSTSAAGESCITARVPASGGATCSSELADDAYLVVIMGPSVGVNQIAEPRFGNLRRRGSFQESHGK